MRILEHRGLRLGRAPPPSVRLARMYVRKLLDIGWSDLATALLGALSPGDRRRVRVALEERWSASGKGLACLSVRTGLDLYLRAAAFPAGTRILVTALNIPDMVHILEAHGLVPVPVELGPRRVFPDAEELEQSLPPDCGAILVAHLFGARSSLDEVVRFAREHQLKILEDCAQAWRA